jgi:hypothetical protein
VPGEDNKSTAKALLKQHASLFGRAMTPEFTGRMFEQEGGSYSVRDTLLCCHGELKAAAAGKALGLRAAQRDMETLSEALKEVGHA